MSEAKRKREPRKIPDVLTPDEEAALLAQPNPRYPTGQRNRLMLQLMLDTGLRLSEATGLKWGDLDLTTGKLKVRQGKGAKDRILWVGDEDLDALRKWRDRQAQAVAGDPSSVFTTLDGKPVSPRYVQAMVKRYATKAGIARSVHPHLLRHSFATDLLRQAKNIRIVQRALGHARLATTEIYTHIVDEELEGALKSFRQPAPITA
jgi:integrase/recombinase XerD